MNMRSDLPQLLVKAGLTILEEEGAEGLTLRRIAARAGVSHAAPAHHFGGLTGLKNAIATQGFQAFYGDLVAAQDSLPGDADPFQRLLTVSLAYIRFARHHPALFRLMFEQWPTQDDDLRMIAQATYVVLHQCCTPLVQDRKRAPFETAIWAMTHGFAMLNLDQPYPPGSPVQMPSYEEALRLLVG